MQLQGRDLSPRSVKDEGYEVLEYEDNNVIILIIQTSLNVRLIAIKCMIME